MSQWTVDEIPDLRYGLPSFSLAPDSYSPPQRQNHTRDRRERWYRILYIQGAERSGSYVQELTPSWQALLEKNAKVYIASRDSEKTTNALANLKKETGHDAILIPIDLTDLHSVRRAAETFLQ